MDALEELHLFKNHCWDELILPQLAVTTTFILEFMWPIVSVVFQINQKYYFIICTKQLVLLHALLFYCNSHCNYQQTPKNRFAFVIHTQFNCMYDFRAPQQCSGGNTEHLPEKSSNCSAEYSGPWGQGLCLWVTYSKSYTTLRGEVGHWWRSSPCNLAKNPQHFL